MARGILDSTIGDMKQVLEFGADDMEKRDVECAEQDVEY